MAGTGLTLIGLIFCQVQENEQLDELNIWDALNGEPKNGNITFPPTNGQFLSGQIFSEEKERMNENSSNNLERTGSLPENTIHIGAEVENTRFSYQ